MKEKDYYTSKEKTLENFMKQFFPFKNFVKIGFFTKEMKGDYTKQAEKVCHFFGYETVYEYGKHEVRCHISYPRTLSVTPKGELYQDPFITVIPSIF